jgi:hypothetical protein
MFWKRKTESAPRKYLGDLIDGVQFVGAATEWSQNFGEIGNIKKVCHDNNLGMEHGRATQAVFAVASSIMALMTVRDRAKMNEEERLLSSSADELKKSFNNLSELTISRNIDVSAVLIRILRLLQNVLERAGPGNLHRAISGVSA